MLFPQKSVILLWKKWIMSRKRREISSTWEYHIVLKGNHSEDIFFSDGDRNSFIRVMEESVYDTFKIYCFCLMRNHVHLLVYSENISDDIKNIASRYAMLCNSKYSLIGHFFQGRFRSEAVEDDEYFFNCVRYILKNPIKAKITDSIDYKWNSYVYYFSGRDDSFVTIDRIEEEYNEKTIFDLFLSKNREDQKIMDIDDFVKPEDNEIIEYIQSLGFDIDLSKYPKTIVKDILIHVNNAFPKCTLVQFSKVTGLSYYKLKIR